jgi:hypothetical protein
LFLPTSRPLVTNNVFDSRLAHEFTQNALRIGKIIIAETFEPDEKKTIQPQDVGGKAGGLK